MACSPASATRLSGDRRSPDPAPSCSLSRRKQAGVAAGSRRVHADGAFMRISRRVDDFRHQRHDRAFSRRQRLAQCAQCLFVGRTRHHVDRQFLQRFGSDAAIERGNRQPFSCQRRKGDARTRRRCQHAIAGSQSLDRLRHQRLRIRPHAKHAAARVQHQRVRLARRPRQVDRPEIDARRGCDRPGPFAAQMLAQDRDAVGPRRPAAECWVRQMLGQRLC